MTQSKDEITNQIIKIKDNRLDIRHHFSLIFANFLAKHATNHKNVHVVDELVTEDTINKFLDQNNYSKPYVLMFYAHKPTSDAVSPYFPSESRAHTSLLLCNVQEGKINHVLNIDGYNFPSYVNPSSNGRINERLIIQSHVSLKSEVKTPLQQPSWENMNCVLYAFTFAKRILEIFNQPLEILTQLTNKRPNLEIAILEGMVGTYVVKKESSTDVKKEEREYLYDGVQTVQYHNKQREIIATAFLKQHNQDHILPAHSSKKPSENSQQILSNIIQALIDNIEHKNNGRKTSGINSQKVRDLQSVQKKISKNSDVLENTCEAYQAYLHEIMKICERKRNQIHFWSTPHSVKEYLTLLASKQIKFVQCVSDKTALV